MLFEEICDEISLAMKDVIPHPQKAGGTHSGSIRNQGLTDSYVEDWVAVNALAAMRDVICRASNRVFVGLPLCM